jgi:hypothetical protein
VVDGDGSVGRASATTGTTGSSHGDDHINMQRMHNFLRNKRKLNDWPDIIRNIINYRFMGSARCSTLERPEPFDLDSLMVQIECIKTCLCLYKYWRWR